MANIIPRLAIYAVVPMHDLISAIIEQLQAELATAVAASNQAHDSATHTENIADNKYDTLALEAAYLAHGQSNRVAELKQSISLYQKYQRPVFDAEDEIELGALVCIEDGDGQLRRLLIGPTAGGLCIKDNRGAIQVITPATPLGNALIGKCISDKVYLGADRRKGVFCIVSVE